MSTNRSVVLVTGATGFLGSHFVLGLLTRSPELEVVALVRGESLTVATERLHTAIRVASDSYGNGAVPKFDRLQVRLGDLNLPALGLDAASREWLAQTGISAFFHSAASLDFSDTNRERVLRANVTGTKHALALARRVGAKRFVYVSTAYSCGRASGVVPETLHSLRKEFNNVYEYSKCKAEHLVARACRRWEMQWSVWRPSIIVGPAATYRTGGSDTGLYGFAREMLRMRRCLTTANSKPYLLADAACRVNLVPVDGVVERMVSWLSEDFPGSPVRHLTSPNAPSVAAVINTVATECGVTNLGIAPVADPDAAPLQKLLDRRMDFYSSYLVGDKSFAGGEVHPDGVSQLELTRFVRASLTERKTLAEADSWVCSRLRTSDGCTLRVYESGNRRGEPLVLVNALGVAYEIFEPLRRALSERYRLLTWDSRGLPGEDGELSADQARFDCHVRDLERVAKHYDLSRFHLLGYCTGADVALQAASVIPSRVLSLSLVSGAFIGREGPQTAFQRSLWEVTPQLAESRQRAALHHRLLYGSSRSTDAAAARWHDLAGSLDANLIHLINVPFETPENLHRYARLLCGFEAPRATRPLACPTLVLAAEQDRITHPAVSVAIAEQHGAQCEMFPGLGHFALHTSDALLRTVEAFLAKATPQLAAVA